MTVIRVQPRRCNDCQKETVIVQQTTKEGYLVIVTQCKNCEIEYQNAFKL